MNIRHLTGAAIASILAGSMYMQVVVADSFVERNSNIVGTTPPGQYRGIPGMQDNEVHCAINPLLIRNLVCAWNASGGSDDPAGPGDTAIRMSESLDGGETWENRYINGTRLNPATSINVGFTADPITMCWAGGCGILHIGANRSETSGGTGGGIYFQRMADSNIDNGFRKRLEPSPRQVYRTTGSKFADKVNGTFILDEENPGTVEVTMEVERPGGGTELITRQWPRGRILAVFALFNPSKIDIEILSTYSDDFGVTWSNPKQVAVTSGRDQGVAVTAIGNTVLYTFRVFGDEDEPSKFMGAVSTDGGQRIGKPFDIVNPLCAYDVPTLPNANNTTTVASRSNDFPSVSNDGSNFIMVYSERRPSSDGGCFTTFDAPTDSRIKAVVGYSNGRNWSEPVEISPNPDHGFQFMPVVDCSLGICQVGWWDSRFDSQRVRNYLENVSTNPAAPFALNAFLNFPVLGDFNFNTGPDSFIQFRRTARVVTKKVRVDSGTAVPEPEPPAIVSQYQRALIGGEVREIERDPWNIKAYKTSTKPFMGDYGGMTSAKHRLVFDPDNPQSPPFWEDNSGPDPRNPALAPIFWMSFVSSRNVRGDIFTARIEDAVPYARTPGGTTVTARSDAPRDPTGSGGNEMAALSVDDFNPGAGFCAPAPNPGPGIVFDALNNRTKDFDVFGARIENQAVAVAFNPIKSLNIQRALAILAENASLVPKTFRFEIGNQPEGFPEQARASWDQLPFDPADPTFATTPPNTSETIVVKPQSSEATALFIVSAEPINPVAVNVYEVFDDGTETLLNTIIANGSIESGPFLNADGTENDFELHNPLVYTPDEFNPDEFNPDEYNPDEFNPDLYTPDEFNPDEFNPDEFNPDEFNPDEFNPDEFNPDEFNPDEFNPDEFNPDEFNSPLVDPADLDNPDIPDPDLGSIEGLVVKLDINYGIQNVGNTATPYTVDFAVSDPEVLALLESGELVTQLIAWQDKKITDVQFCEPRLISENRVVAAVNNPDLTTLQIPDINNNRLGIMSYVIAPNDVLQNTIRFIAPLATMQLIAPKLTSDNISYVFASMAANTGSTSLFVDEEIVIDDRRPATFNFTAGDTSTFEASGPGGAVLPANFIQADRNGEIVPVSCTPALGSLIPLDIDNVPAGPTALSCSATTSNGVTSTLDMFVSVLDTSAPTIDPTSVPANIIAEAASAAGTPVVFSTPTALDALGVDTSVDVACVPASGDVFTFVAPGPTTTAVTCTATDDSGNTDSASFDVTIQDTTAPAVTGLSPPIFDRTEPFVLAPDLASFRLAWGPIDVTDPDPNIDVSCSVGVLDLTQPLYTFVHAFGVGTTTVNCAVSDSNGNTETGSFDVTVFDETAPVLTLNGDATITIDTNHGPYVDPGANAFDNADGDVSADVVIDSSAVDTTTAGTYTVFISVADSSGNVSELTRTVIVEFRYGGTTGIIPAKTTVKLGSSAPLDWAWLDSDRSRVDSSGDIQRLRIVNCSNGDVVLQMAGDPGSSGFRFKSDFWWQFNWQVEGVAVGQSYCASVESSRTGQMQFSPPIRVR